MTDGARRNVLTGLAIATGAALAAAVPTIAGISTWEYALAAIGLVIFVAAGLDRGNDRGKP